MKTIVSLFSKLNNQSIKGQIIGFTIAVYSGFLFYSGVSKYLSLLDFAFGMTNFNLFSEEAVFFFTYLIPLFEIILGILILFKKTMFYSLVLVIGLFTLYTLYLVLFKFNATSGWCSCGSIIDLNLPNHILFNLVITLPLLLIVLNYEKWGVK